MIAQLAVILYGALTLVGAFCVAAWQGSLWGMVLVVLAAGVTYLFQALQIAVDEYGNGDARILNVLWGVVILLFVAGLGVSIWS